MYTERIIHFLYLIFIFYIMYGTSLSTVFMRLFFTYGEKVLYFQPRAITSAFPSSFFLVSVFVKGIVSQEDRFFQHLGRMQRLRNAAAFNSIGHLIVHVEKHIFCAVVNAEKHVPLRKPTIFVNHYELQVELQYFMAKDGHCYSDNKKKSQICMAFPPPLSPFSKALIHKGGKARGNYLDVLICILTT